MNLAAVVQSKAKTRPSRLIDRIYSKLDPTDRETLLALIGDPEIPAAHIGAALRDLGHDVSNSTITAERRDGWEPM